MTTPQIFKYPEEFEEFYDKLNHEQAKKVAYAGYTAMKDYKNHHGSGEK